METRLKIRKYDSIRRNIKLYEIFKNERDVCSNFLLYKPDVYAHLIKHLNLRKNFIMIRVLIRKEQPFEIHVIVNPTEALDIEKIEVGGHHHVGDYDGDNQVDQAVEAVGVYLELEEDKV